MRSMIPAICLSICMFCSYAQESEVETLPVRPDNRLYFGIEAGIVTFDNQGIDYDFIREEAVYYFGYYDNYSQISLKSYMPVFTLKAEYRAFSDRLWLSGGIGYAFMKSSMGEINRTQNETDYLYLLLDQHQDETYYYRISSIEGTDHYIGIPLGIRYSPFVPRFFRLYFKLGIEAGFKISSNQSVRFFDAKMKPYEDAVLDLFRKPKTFYSSGSLGIGFQLGKQDRPNIRIEADLPLVVFTPEAFALMEHEMGGGLNLSFILPLKSR